MIELRLDFLREWSEQSIAGLAADVGSLDGEVIATCRLAEEGGNFKRDETERMKLIQAVASCADYVDIEYEAWRRSELVRQTITTLLRDGKGGRALRLILSKHDFERTPPDLVGTLEAIATEPCDVAKIACRAETIVDALRILEALRASSGRRATIALGMGETGVLTRVLARKFGAMLTFAALETGKESAPGQITIDQMRSLYRWDSISPETRVYGVIGCPVAHSMSPAIHDAAFDKVNYDGIYLPMRVEPDYASFEAFVDATLARPWFDLRGCSVTIPHKENLLRYVEQRGGEIEPLAKRIGVANTLCVEFCGTGVPPVIQHQRDAGATTERNTGETPVPRIPQASTTPVKLSAFNTDYRGALDALCDGMGIAPEALADRKVAVLGAGGVARAIVAGLRDCGCDVTIYNRTHAKAEALAAEFGATARPVDERVDNRADAIVNCTSIGMWPDVDATPLPPEGMTHRPAVFDTVYNPVETRLLREARAQGCPTIDGVSMFVNQAVAQFERWTGRKAPVDLMREVVLARLAG
jgi:3-dehydroquinate dehydratase/shikimate dehydrogenase